MSTGLGGGYVVMEGNEAQFALRSSSCEPSLRGSREKPTQENIKYFGVFHLLI